MTPEQAVAGQNQITNLMDLESTVEGLPLWEQVLASNGGEYPSKGTTFSKPYALQLLRSVRERVPSRTASIHGRVRFAVPKNPRRASPSVYRGCGPRRSPPPKKGPTS